MSRLSLKIFVFVLCLATASAWAGNPAPLFNRPVKLDQSGRPLYNSWELQEIQRRERKKRKSGDWRRRDGSHETQAQGEGAVSPAQPSGNSPATRAAGTSAIQGGPGFGSPVKAPGSTSTVP